MLAMNPEKTEEQDYMRDLGIKPNETDFEDLLIRSVRPLQMIQEGRSLVESQYNADWECCLDEEELILYE